MVFGQLCIGVSRARSTAAGCTWRKGTPVAPAVGVRAAEHWLLAYCALGATFCTLWTRGVWSAARVWTQGLAWHIGTPFQAHCVHRQKGRCLAWYPCFFGRATVWQPHTADTRNCDTTNLVRTMLAKVSHTGTNFTGRAQPHWSIFCMVRASSWPRHFLATCTRWIGTALTPRPWCRRWFQRCAALWADFGGCCLQVGCFPPTLATNAVIGFGVILVQVGHADDVPTRAALPAFALDWLGWCSSHFLQAAFRNSFVALRR